MAPPIYDIIGKGYSKGRAADPRIVDRLTELLDLPKGSSLLDVGAGTGNYSLALAESDYFVTALEPSRVMRDQGKTHKRLFWKEGIAEELPFSANAFEGVFMTLCMHHFSDWRKGLKEAMRVCGSGPVVILTFDAFLESNFWLFDYFPLFLEKDKEWFPKLEEMRTFSEAELLADLETFPFALPPDLTDHFAAAGWARPEVYLDEHYRRGISSFSSTDHEAVKLGISKLEADLKSGAWDAKNGHLRDQESLNVGYVFVKLERSAE
ncbi:MAG: methyltransferase domain-containing protein [Symploca sp. SIO2D2]|nr:methyltransferase domain-containing protein [Symploca sp. SIO2D2]